MATCENPRCGKRLIVVNPDRPYHPTPQCDPSGDEWLMTPDEIAALAAEYFPLHPEQTGSDQR